MHKDLAREAEPEQMIFRHTKAVKSADMDTNPDGGQQISMGKFPLSTIFFLLPTISLSAVM